MYGFSALETAAKVFLDQTQYPNIDWVRMFNAKYNKKFLSTESNCEVRSPFEICIASIRMFCNVNINES